LFTQIAKLTNLLIEAEQPYFNILADNLNDTSFLKLYSIDTANNTNSMITFFDSFPNEPIVFMLDESNTIGMTRVIDGDIEEKGYYYNKVILENIENKTEETTALL